MTESQDRALEGFSIVLTGDRRSEEFTASFTRRGAQVLQAPVLRIIPLVDDQELRAATERVIAEPPDVVIATTAIGFRGWIEAADAADMAPDLLRVLAKAELLARGPKAKGAIRAAGLTESWAAESETTTEVVDRLVAEGVAGRRVVMQLHGLTDQSLLTRLTQAGAELSTVAVYRWGPSPNPAAVMRAFDAIVARTTDAVVFTSAPGAQAFLDTARNAGRLMDVLTALRHDVVSAAVGPITAGPLEAVGLQPLVPDRFRLGALVRALSDHLESDRIRVVPTHGGVLQLRGQAARLDAEPLVLSPAPMAMLRMLATRPGDVYDRAQLLTGLPGSGDLHAVEMAVARLRSALGTDPARVVQTVVKRGYRLNTMGS